MLGVRSLVRIQARNLSQIASSSRAITSEVPKILSPVFNVPSLNLGVNLTRRIEIKDVPLTPKVVENPLPVLNEIDEIISRITDLRLPTQNKVIEKQAVRLIVIRRRKMRRHKLKKLRKRMKFHWAKLRVRRELRKEKLFQAELMAQIKEAEKFSAEAYVAEKLQQLNHKPLPRFWKGKRLPQFIIKDLVAEDKLKKEKKQARQERIEKYRNWKL